MTALVVLAGLGQLGLAAGSLAIPRVLGWREETMRLTRLTRQVFWTYSVYIWGTNVCMGALSAFAPALLLDGGPLARAVCGYTALYWGARLALQLFCYDRAVVTTAALRVAEVALAVLFLFFTATYGYLLAR
jgi:hypothetical protein